MTRRSPSAPVHAISRDERWSRLGTKGATVWLTGLSGSGKSSIARRVEARLIERGMPAYVLDGDSLRQGISEDLTFTRHDRGENARRAAEIAKLFADSGVVAVVALISPYAADRAQARSIHADADLVFLEVHVATDLADCEARDPKGLYARARAGAVANFTMVDDPYEVPETPDLVVTTEGNAEENAGTVLELLLRTLHSRSSPA